MIMTEYLRPFLNFMNAGRLIVLTGPSGVGKGTLLKELLQRHPELYVSISATTRSPRPDEVDGINYYFLTRDRFTAMIAAGEFLEWAEFASNYYGTPTQPVQAQINQGRSVILEIELLGARQVAKIFPGSLKIFILPPSLAELEARIRSRGQDSEAAIQKRLAHAQVEMRAADEFDLQIVNDDLTIALGQIEAAIF
jgi:guanylate kinase